jgi:Rod binding domain-containing protein
MTITPPGDIVLGVARAVDPARYREAVARLDRIAGGSASEPFAVAAGEAADAARPAAAGAAPRAEPPSPSSATITPAARKAYRGFESMVLANFLGAAFPDQATSVFGSGTAGGMWKSMLVQAMADQMARAGGVGIAEQLARSAAREAAATATAAATAGAGQGTTGLDMKRMVMTMERELANRLADGHASGNGAGS